MIRDPLFLSRKGLLEKTYPHIRDPFRYRHLKSVLQMTQGRIVGGGVRNPLLNLPVIGEIDIASPLAPDIVLKIGKRAGFTVVPINIDHGTVLFVKNGEKYEITTLREDVVTDGRWAKVRYTRSWTRDAQRRDFTINAIYMDAKGYLYDYVGGLVDLDRRILRFVGNPTQRIREDYLRIIRMFRFWAHYVPPSENDLCAAIAEKDGLAGISKERILDEMLKLYKAPDPWDAAKSMYKHGIVLKNDPNLVTNLEISRLKLSPLTRLALTVDTSQWPLSRAQKSWVVACKVPAGNIGDILERMYEFGLQFAVDVCLIYKPELLTEVLAIVDSVNERGSAEFPLLPSELPVPPGPEMGKAYKQVRRWWSRQYPAPSKEDCLSWWLQNRERCV